ncbi:iron chaperone [Lacrimispora brassicae]
MQYEANSPKEYLGLLENDWRKEKLLHVRRLILEYGSELEEGILYKMLCYGNEESNLFGLNAQKSYVSLYVGTIQKIENASMLLTGFDYGKGCIRIKKTIDINKTGLEAFIKQTIDKWRAGEDTSC